MQRFGVFNNNYTINSSNDAFLQCFAQSVLNNFPMPKFSNSEVTILNGVCDSTATFADKFFLLQ
jgi:hypothetical protein